MPTFTIESFNAVGVQRAGVDEPWTTIARSAGNGLYSSSGNYVGYADKSDTATQWKQLIRLIVPFDTSGIGPGQVIDAAVVELYGFTKANHGGVNQPSVGLYPCTPTVNGFPQASDYERCADTVISDVITFAAWSLGSTAKSTPNAFTLTAAGLARINPLGWTTLAGRFTWDAGLMVPPDWNAFAIGAWTGDPTLRPRITVTYHAAPGAPIDQRIDVDAIALGAELHLDAIMGGLDA